MNRWRRMETAVGGTVLLFSVCSALAAGAPGQEPWDTEIVWQDPSHTEPAFLPQGLLSEVDWSDPATAVADSRLHLPETAASELRALLEGPTYTQKMQRLGQAPAASGCAPAPITESSIYDPPPGSLTVLEIAQTYRLVFVGRIVGLVDGLNAYFLRPSRRVVIRVEKVLRDPGNVVEVEGTTSFIVEDTGAIRLGSRRECVDIPEGAGEFYQPVVGDRVLFTGVGLDSNQVVQAHFLFKVEGDQLVSQPFTQLKPGPLPSLTEVEQALEAQSRNSAH